jgi:hypothetical protein
MKLTILADNVNTLIKHSSLESLIMILYNNYAQIVNMLCEKFKRFFCSEQTIIHLGVTVYSKTQSDPLYFQ